MDYEYEGPDRIEMNVFTGHYSLDLYLENRNRTTILKEIANDNKISVEECTERLQPVIDIVTEKRRIIRQYNSTKARYNELYDDFCGIDEDPKSVTIGRRLCRMSMDLEQMCIELDRCDAMICDAVDNTRLKLYSN